VGYRQKNVASDAFRRRTGGLLLPHGNDVSFALGARADDFTSDAKPVRILLTQYLEENLRLDLIPGRDRRARENVADCLSTPDTHSLYYKSRKVVALAFAYSPPFFLVEGSFFPPLGWIDLGSLLSFRSRFISSPSGSSNQA